MSDTIITLNCLLLPDDTTLRSKLSEGSITTLKISTHEIVDQLRIILEKGGHAYLKRFLLPTFYSERSMIPGKIHQLKTKLKNILVGNVKMKQECLLMS